MNLVIQESIRRHTKDIKHAFSKRVMEGKGRQKITAGNLWRRSNSQIHAW